MSAKYTRGAVKHINTLYGRYAPNLSYEPTDAEREAKRRKRRAAKAARKKRR
jgi:hypothetical protein